MSAVITSIVCSLILNISILFIIKRLINSNSKLLTIKNIILIVLLSLLQTIFYSKDYNITYVISNYLAIMLFVKIIFKETMTKTILSTIIVILFLIIADFIASMVIVTFPFNLNEIRAYWYLRIISNVLIAILCNLIFIIPVINKRCKYFVLKFETGNFPIVVLFIILLTSIIFIGHGVISDYSFSINFLSNLFIILTLITFCYIFINENNEFNILNEKYDSLFNYVQTFENWIEKEQLNRHEYKNQLASIRCITKEKKVRDKIDSIMLDNINITNDTVNQLKPIPNGGLKGLLYYKIAIAENNKLNVELDISIKNPDIIKKLTEDKIKILCRLLGIYLDNAIEAAKETKKKIISIEIYEVDKNINIVITNTFDNTNDISKRNDKGFTTKGHGHGKGLYFAKKMLDKSNWLEESQSILDKYYIQRLIIKK